MILRGDNGVERKGQRGRKGWVGEKNLNMHVNPPPTCMESALLSTWGWVQCICSSSLRLLFLSLSLLYLHPPSPPSPYPSHSTPSDPPLNINSYTGVQKCGIDSLSFSSSSLSSSCVWRVMCVSMLFFYFLLAAMYILQRLGDPVNA